MDSIGLPSLKLVGRAANVPELAQLLLEAVTGSMLPFIGYDIIRGEQRSGRVLFRETPMFVTAVPFERGETAIEMAQMLLLEQLLRESRFDPPNANLRFQRGWEVSRGAFDDQEVVVVRAAWVKA